MNEVKNVGVANDGYEYNENSAEVLKYKEVHADVADDAAVGAVVGFHNAILEGKTPVSTGDGDDIVIGLVTGNIATKSEAVAESSEEAPVAESSDETPAGENSES